MMIHPVFDLPPPTHTHDTMFTSAARSVFSASARRGGVNMWHTQLRNSSTARVMVDRNTKVICQGMTGKQVRSSALTAHKLEHRIGSTYSFFSRPLHQRTSFVGHVTTI